MTIRSVWHVNNSQTREDTRFAPLGIMTPASDSALTTSNGVVPTAGNPMNLTSTGTMTAQIGIGRAVVQGLQTQGCYPVVITAPEAISFGAGDASNPRIDSVQIVIRDDPYDSTGFTDVRVVVVPGTPAASPSSPALVTAASIRLWDVRVEAGVSAGSGGIDWNTKLTDRRGYCVALGGISVGGPTLGSYAGQWRDGGGAAGTLNRFNGTSWESFVRLDAGGQLVIGDTNLRRDASNVLATDDLFRIYRSAASDNAISLRTPSDTGASRWFINADGSMNWGPGGTSATDTNLYRAAADVLKTDSKLRSEVEVVTSGITGIASGWSLNSFYGRRTAQVVTLDLYFNRTGADITLSSGNLADFNLCTVPAGWRPQHDTINGSWDNGVAFGGVVVGTDGIVTVRSSSGTISSGTNMRLTFTLIQVN